MVLVTGQEVQVLEVLQQDQQAGGHHLPEVKVVLPPEPKRNRERVLL